MANSKEVAPFNTQTINDEICNQKFIDELLPCSQQVSLLYHVSYLCLAKFPKCEKLLRMRAVETQLLFGSSEAALMKCVGTSHNLVTSLFPMLVAAIEKHKPTVVVKYLEKARAWITDLIGNVEQMVEKYEVHNRDVAATTSDINTEKKETENKITEVSKEIKAIETTIETLKDQLTKTTTELTEIEREIDAKNRELQDFVKSVTSTSKVIGLFAAIVPFIGPIIKNIYDTVTAPGVAEKTKALEEELKQLDGKKITLKQEEWDLQVQLIDWQMKLSKVKTEQGLITDPVHLSEVQRYLSKIQDILLKLAQLWKTVDSLLGTIKEKTFVGEDLVDDPDFKDMFLTSIQDASEMWTVFGGRCNQCVQMFRVQSKDAYKFLEIDPNTLSPAVWQQEYDSVIQQLKKIKVSGEDETPAVMI